jgi:hypothetical protein
MATKTSNGTGGGVYATGSSWIGGVAPVDGEDDVVINGGDSITAGADIAPASITIDSSGGGLNLSTYKTVNTIITLTAGTLSGSGEVGANTFTYNGGTYAHTGLFDVGIHLILGAHWTISTPTSTALTMNLRGAFTLTMGVDFTLDGNCSIYGGATLDTNGKRILGNQQITLGNALDMSTGTLLLKTGTHAIKNLIAADPAFGGTVAFATSSTTMTGTTDGTAIVITNTAATIIGGTVSNCAFQTGMTLTNVTDGGTNTVSAGGARAITLNGTTTWATAITANVTYASSIATSTFGAGITGNLTCYTNLTTAPTVSGTVTVYGNLTYGAITVAVPQSSGGEIG